MMSFVKKYKLFLAGAAVAVAVLAIAFFMGGNPSVNHKSSEPTKEITTAEVQAESSSAENTEETEAKNKEKESTIPATKPTEQTSQPASYQSAAQPATSKAKYKNSDNQNKEASAISKTEKAKVKDKYKTDPVPEGKPKPVEPEEQTVADKKANVTFSISCASVLNNMDKLDLDKRDIVPEDGWILKPVNVTINEGETVFDVLKRVCKENKVHMEFSFTPIYNSAYIEGIGNLYEFDCGSGSGWMYQVDSWFPNYGCSRYTLKGGETIEWKYTTDIGNDIGGSYNQWEGE